MHLEASFATALQWPICTYASLTLSLFNARPVAPFVRVDKESIEVVLQGKRFQRQGRKDPDTEYKNDRKIESIA